MHNQTINIIKQMRLGSHISFSFGDGTCVRLWRSFQQEYLRENEILSKVNSVGIHFDRVMRLNKLCKIEQKINVLGMLNVGHPVFCAFPKKINLIEPLYWNGILKEGDLVTIESLRTLDFPFLASPENQVDVLFLLQDKTQRLIEKTPFTKK